MTAARPDSRVELLDSLTMNGIPTAPPRSWVRIIEAVEGAGLLVLDPSSDALVERIARAVINAADVKEGEVGTITFAVLAALGDPS